MNEKRKYNFKPVEELEFTDDFMFGAIMRNEHICKGVLERLLPIKVSKIEYPELQKTINPFYSKKGIRLDVYIADSDKIYDIEMQTYTMESVGKRTRYYQAMIDIDSLMKGAFYSELKESFIIFLCMEDPFEKKLPVYTFERKCIEDNSVELEDKTHHLIFNCSAFEKEENEELKKFLHFLKTNEANSDFTREIKDMVQTKKFEQTFVNEYLAWNLHNQDVEKRKALQDAKNLLMLKLLTFEQIAQVTGLTVEQIKNIKI